MTMKKKLIAVLCAALLPVSGVLAAPGVTEVSVAQEGKRVMITGTLQEAAVDAVSYYILKPDSGVPSTDTIMEQSAAMGQITEITDGTFSFAVPMREELPSGTYRVVLNTVKGGDPVTAEFKFLSSAEQKALIALLNEGNAGKIKASLEEADSVELYRSMGCLTEDYQAMSPALKEKLCGLLAKGFGVTKPFTEENVAQGFNRALAYTVIVLDQNSDTAPLLVKYAKLLEIDTEGLVSDPYLDQRMHGLGENGDIDKLVKAYNEARAVMAVNGVVSYQDMRGVLEDHQKILGISFGSYNKLSPSQRTKVDKAMVGREFATVGEVKQAFDKAVADAGDDKGSGTGGGGGGGGGGGSKQPPMLPSQPDAAPTPAPTAQPEQKGFTDLDNVAWAKEAIESLYDRGIVNGTGEHTFSPERSVTRGEFIKMLISAFGLTDENASCEFTDVAPEDWSYPYIASAVKLGISNGLGDGTFGVGLEITREDMASLVSRTMEQAGRSLEKVRDIQAFTDKEEIHDYAYEGVASLYEAGVLNGFEDGSFRPAGSATRAQAAKLLYSVLENK